MSELQVGDTAELIHRARYFQVLPTGKRVLLKARRGKKLTVSEVDGDKIYWNEDGQRYRAYSLDLRKL